MNSILKLVGYHIALFLLFSFFVVVAFYVSEGGDLSTPTALITYYVISSVLTYIPLLLTLTCFNFIVLAIGLNSFSGLLKRCVICFLPLVFFALWFLLSENNVFLNYYNLTDIQFIIIIGIWFLLLVIGTFMYSGLTQYSEIAVTIGISFAVYFLLHKYNIYPSSLMLTDFQFKTILTIWAVLNCIIISSYRAVKSLPMPEIR
jgi:hypothetical protein